MAYSQNNLSAVGVRTVSGSRELYFYISADPQATVAAAGYISNAGEMGMGLGDIVWVFDTATPTTSMHRVTALSVAGVANLSAGLVIT